MINRKIKAVLKIKLKPILCVGETQKDRKTNRTQIVIKSQIRKALQKIPKKEIKNLILAYEPVWAIGTGRACGISEAKSVNSFIKKIVKNTPILYGGSVNSKNARGYLKEANFQGLLVGGASLNVKEFITIIKKVNGS
jgi:triosephosphate isomerase